ncbi:hypothetical protein JOD43_003556 [Pullulanibacillus pueri]|uniref:MucB/RseB N-terminal domain-containing protein n=1 Tax=Pullulanibacillus pueri TaxID=1437324 RepID=A0A8J3EN27_9BACL|nr:hypothetical protein [Pullulanibacillus pueri]MBM7683376.1 hypothetical protein [Pullulanibacillus pueri]GGH86557.1 hypothetical protein GCM10007096_34540 [Pullulanibacillus pueri]
MDYDAFKKEIDKIDIPEKLLDRSMMKGIKRSEKSQKKKWEIYFDRGVRGGMSAAVVFICFLLLYSLTHHSHTPYSSEGVSKNTHQAESLQPHRNQEGDTSTQASPSEDRRTLTKAEVLYRMMNTMDYFNSVQGSFITDMGSVKKDDKDTVDYSLAFQNNTYESYVKVRSTDETQIQINTGKKHINLYHDKTYNTSGQIGYQKGKPIKLDEIKGALSDGHTAWSPRNRPVMLYGSSTLFPFEIAESYLMKNTDWDIESQNANYLGHEAVILTGHINRLSADKTPITSFKMWINKGTGILLRMENYDKKGNLIEFMKTTRLKFNKGIDEKLLTIPEGYKKVN